MACTHMNGMNVLHRVWSFTYSCWWMDGRMAAWLVPGRKNHFAPDVGQSDINYSQHYTTVVVAESRWSRTEAGRRTSRNCAHLLTHSFILSRVEDAWPIIHCGQIQISSHRGLWLLAYCFG